MSDVNAGGVDLDASTPAGKRTVDYAVELLLSTHLPEVQGAETWLLNNAEEALPALVAALETTAAQPAAVLLGALGRPEAIEPLAAAHHRGGEGLKAAVERGLALNGSTEAEEALTTLRDRGQG